MTKRQLTGLIKLTRYRDYILTVAVTTLLGVAFTREPLTFVLVIRIVVTYLANLSAVAFAFMINDVEDAPDDALNPDKKNRNPVSAKVVSRKLAYAASFAIASLALVFAFWLGFQPFLITIGTIMLGYLYSWRIVRIKRIPFADMISHGLMLGGFQLLAGYVSIKPVDSLSLSWILPTLFAFTVSLYGELQNEMRDLQYDRIAGITHTASFVGETIAKGMMYGVLLSSAFMLIVTIILGFIPLWVVGLAGIGGFVFLAFLRFRQDQYNGIVDTTKYHDPIYITTLLVLFIWITLQ